MFKDFYSLDSQAANKLLDELCHLKAQSLPTMDTSEHFKVLKLLGEGSYGKVMLAVHRKTGEEIKHISWIRISSDHRSETVSLSSCRFNHGSEVLPP